METMNLNMTIVATKMMISNKNVHRKLQIKPMFQQPKKDKSTQEKLKQLKQCSKILRLTQQYAKREELKNKQAEIILVVTARKTMNCCTRVSLEIQQTE